MSLLSDRLVSVREKIQRLGTLLVNQRSLTCRKEAEKKAQGQAVRALQGDKNPSRTSLTNDALLTHLD